MIGRAAKTVLRRSRQQARPPRKVCPFCFEGDHIGARNYIPHVLVEICQLHHAYLTEERLAAGAEREKQPNAIQSVEMALRSLAVTGRANARAIDKLCEGLEFCAEKLKSLSEASLHFPVGEKQREINMADRLDLHFRAHTVPAKPQKEHRTNRNAKRPSTRSSSAVQQPTMQNRAYFSEHTSAPA